MSYCKKKILSDSKHFDIFWHCIQLAMEGQGEFERSYECFNDLVTAETHYNEWCNYETVDAEEGSIAVSKMLEVCTDNFAAKIIDKFLKCGSRPHHKHKHVLHSIEINYEARRALGDFCKAKKCDYSDAILALTTGAVIVEQKPKKQEPDHEPLSLADQVAEKIYEKLGKRMEDIELSLGLMNINMDQDFDVVIYQSIPEWVGEDKYYNSASFRVARDILEGDKIKTDPKEICKKVLSLSARNISIPDKLESIKDYVDALFYEAGMGSSGVLIKNAVAAILLQTAMDNAELILCGTGDPF